MDIDWSWTASKYTNSTQIITPGFTVHTVYNVTNLRNNMLCLRYSGASSLCLTTTFTLYDAGKMYTVNYHFEGEPTVIYFLNLPFYKLNMWPPGWEGKALGDGAGGRSSWQRDTCSGGLTYPYLDERARHWGVEQVGGAAGSVTADLAGWPARSLAAKMAAFSPRSPGEKTTLKLWLLTVFR